MNDDLAPAQFSAVTRFTYDSCGRLIGLTDQTGRELPQAALAEIDDREGPTFAPVPAFAFEHDAEQKVFRLTAPDGSTEAFRDSPTRYLCVVPDEANGAMRPVLKRGLPVYLYLCREEREAR